MNGTPSATSFNWMRALRLGSLSSLLRFALGFLSIKVTAVYLGPSGLALVAQLANFIGCCNGAVGNGIASATSRLYPEYRLDREARRRLIGTAWRLAVVLACVIGLLIVLAASPIARWLLASGAYAAAVAIGAAAVACLVLAQVINSALNGAGEMGRTVASASLASAAGFAVYVPACALWGIEGGLIGYALSQALALPVAFVMLRGSKEMALADLRGAFDTAFAHRIYGFMPMLVVHSVAQPLGLILVRDALATQLGLDSAGLWQAAWRLSEVYLSVVMASLSIYFLPRLGEVIGTPALRREIALTLARVVGLTAATALAIYLLRDLVVRVVLTEEFLPVRELMPLQLLGDLVRIGGWTLGFVLVALVRSRWYIALELLMPALYFAGTLLFLPGYGLSAAPLAYILASAAHLAVSLFALRDILVHGAHGGASERPRP